MKVRFLLYLIIAILSIFDIVFICQRITGKDTRMVDADLVVAKNDKLKDIIDIMIENQNVLLNGEQTLIDEKFDTLFLSSLINSPKLVFFFNEYSCMPCVDKSVAILDKSIDEIGKKNIIILSYYGKPRDMYLFSHANKIEIPIYNLLKPLNVTLSNIDIPYIFTTKKDLKINNLLLIDQSQLELVESYISILTKLAFFDKSSIN